MSAPVRARQDAVSRTLQELSTDVCSETNPEKDSHVEESSVLQVCAVEEAKFAELQFSCGSRARQLSCPLLFSVASSA